MRIYFSKHHKSGWAASLILKYQIGLICLNLGVFKEEFKWNQDGFDFVFVNAQKMVSSLFTFNATSFWKFVAGRKLKVGSFLQNWLWTTSKLDLHTRLLIISRVEIWPPIFSSPWTLYIMSYMSYVVSELACIRIMRQQFKFFLTFCLQYFAWVEAKASTIEIQKM